MKVTCPTCGDDFQQLAGHWYYNEDHRPEVDQSTMEMLTGCMLGDGNAEKPAENAHLTVYSTNRVFLEHVDKQLGVLSKGVEEKDSGGEWTHEDTQYYRVRTACHPQFNHFRDWYGEKKRFPEIELTPDILRYWYVCDGNLQYDKRCKPPRGRVEIHTSDNADQLDKVAGWFEDTPLPVPATHRHTLRWGTGGSVDVLDWMGDPVPGFERKWKRVLD